MSRTPTLEGAIDALMHAAVWISPAFLLCGLIVWLAEPASAWSGGLLRGGLFALMAIPMLRVVSSVVGALRGRDWLFLAATLLVLVELGVTFTTALLK